MTGQFETVIMFCQGFKTPLRCGVPLKSLASFPPTLHCKHILQSWLRLEASELAGFSVQATAYVEQTEEQSDHQIVEVEFVPVVCWDIFYCSKFLFN